MPSAPPRVYQSAVDTWLMILLYAGPAALVLLGIYAWYQGQADATMACLMLSVGLILLNLLLTAPCRYTLTEDTLNIRCGLLFSSVPLSRVRDAELSSTWQSAPALSLRRVKIKLDRGVRIVSPVQREAFIQDLMAAVEKNQQAMNLDAAHQAQRY